ncbi:ROK family transcriptional regulator [Rhizobium cremeum]|uniref:ROK family transcriptional regulator n=1 Tax=Rhizobium cremeum TaxID=2813827 RepID=UPI000DDAF11A|nr:ROK family transcriptional regulator [Rhizobium cremeum]MCJ7996449.1 ROK family transcriptional regulator [Rhizobium cremeum]MCJ8001708.1 ROK family transcriptional regulator [Rhizobium cremeum]
MFPTKSSSTEIIRRQNSALVLSALRRGGRLAHTELSAATGLSSATVSAITAELERAEILVKSEHQPVGGRGRPRVLFEPRRNCGYLIVVSISSDALEYSLVDYSARLIDRFSESRVTSGGALAFSMALRSGLEKTVTRADLAQSSVLAISISSKGLVDTERPLLLWSPVLGTERIDFGSLLAADWSGRVLLANETQLVAGALASRAKRSGQTGPRALAALSLGHSIGLGVATQSPSGSYNVISPNFGHMLHQANGALCRCGGRGCIEAYAGFYAILRTAFEVPTDTLPAKFVPLSEVDKIAALAHRGDRGSVHAFRQAGLALGNGLSRLLSLYEHMPITITGPGTRYYDLLRQGIEEGLSQSHIVRFSGMPEISVAFDEGALVFEGHLDHALALIDQDIVQLRPQAAGNVA